MRKEKKQREKEIYKTAKEIAKKKVLEENPLISGWENVEDKVNMEFQLNSTNYLVLAIIKFLNNSKN